MTINGDVTQYAMQVAIKIPLNLMPIYCDRLYIVYPKIYLSVGTSRDTQTLLRTRPNDLCGILCS